MFLWRYDPLENRGHQIETISLNVWHIDENNRHELSKSSYGQFYSNDVYIIRWKYKLLPLGSERKTDISRDRVAYWIWQGINANLNEKGISALMSVLLSEEKGANVSW
jgi:supervillin